jgi:hypothetical protein
MLNSRHDQDALWLSHQKVAEFDRFSETAGLGENFGVSSYPDHPTQYLWRHAKARVAVHHFIQPTPAKEMVGRIGPKGVNEDIHVGQDHRLSMMSSRSLDLFRSIPGNVPPEAAETGNRTGLRDMGFGSASTISSPSSISDVNVRPCSAARFLAFRSKVSGSLMVVLICQRILTMHQYVKAWKKESTRSNIARLKQKYQT